MHSPWLWVSSWVDLQESSNSWSLWAGWEQTQNFHLHLKQEHLIHAFWQSINAGHAIWLDVILSLKDIHAIASLVEIFFGFNAHGGKFGLDMLTNFCDEKLASLWSFRAHGKVVNLMANMHVLSIESAQMDVLFMDSVQKSHLVDEDLSDEAFPQNAGFRMFLEGTEDRDIAFVFVQPLTKLVETPITEGIINFQDAID